jgi:hypothetical protein
MIPFKPIARQTARHKITPSIFAAFGYGYNMVYGTFFQGDFVSTISTSAVREF